MWPARWGGSCNKELSGPPPPPMTNRIALTLVVLTAGFFLADLFWLDLGAPVFLGRKFVDFIEFLAFWR